MPRCSSRYISPTQTGALGVLGLAPRGRTPRACRSRTRGEPSRSAVRWAAAIISRVGPPPPSPQPNGTSEHRGAALLAEVALGVGQLGAAELRVVGVDRREVGEDPGAVDALPPEGVVRHPVRLVPGDLLGQEPARAGARARSAAGRRSSRTSRAARPPRTRRRTRRGRTACPRRTGGPSPRRRACFVSDSTHMPPTGTNRPCGDLLADAREQRRVVLLDPLRTAGPRSTANTKSGCSSMSATTLENVRTHLRTVSRSGHSQAESMWACPIAAIRWALAARGRREHAGEGGAAGGGGPGDVVADRRRRACPPGRAGSRAGGWSPRAAAPSGRAASRRPGAAPRRGRRAARAPAAGARRAARRARSPRPRTGSARSVYSPATSGLAAASMSRSMAGPSSGRHGSQLLSGAMALMIRPSGRYASPSAWKPERDRL